MGTVLVDDNLVHVTRLDQAETMRVIRNSCREFMTNDTHEILPTEQQAWFESIRNSETVLPFIYQPRRGAAMGYGLIRFERDKWWVSGGLLPAHRGQGIGKDLFFELADYVNALGHTCWLTVWQWNEPAWRTYQALGFICEPPIVTPDGCVMLEMKREPKAQR